MLEVLQQQHNAHIRELQAKNDPSVSTAQSDIMLFDPDMIVIMNCWRNNTQMWMHPHQLEKLTQLWSSKKYNLIKSRFNAMKFHLLGNEALVDHIIRFNLLGAAQPATLQKFYKRWREHTLTPQYHNAK